MNWAIAGTKNDKLGKVLFSAWQELFPEKKKSSGTGPQVVSRFLGILCYGGLSLNISIGQSYGFANMLVHGFFLLNTLKLGYWWQILMCNEEEDTRDYGIACIEDVVQLMHML